MVWIGSVWSALLPAPEGARSVSPHYKHITGWIQNRLSVKMEPLKAVVCKKSLKFPKKELYLCWTQGVLKGNHLCGRGMVSLYERYAQGAAEPFSLLIAPQSVWLLNWFMFLTLDVIGNNSFSLPASLPFKGQEFSFNWEIKHSLECFNEIKVLSPSHQFYSVSQSSSLYSSPENPKLINLALGILKCLLRKQLCFDRQQL